MLVDPEKVLAGIVTAADLAVTTIAGVESQLDDLQRIATNGRVHDEPLTLLQEIAP